MHSVWVIFKKDARHLWWQVAISLALLAVLVHQEAYRADYYADSLDGWVDLLLPLAWASLLAQAVHGEVLLGDREFWMTRPYRRWQLLTAKALFAAAFVHVPALLSDYAIVLARGLSPVAATPHLLVKQLLLAGAVTLPAMALAAVVRNLMQFVFVGVLAPVAVFAFYHPVQYTWISSVQMRGSFGQEDPLRTAGAILILAATALAMVLLQYLARRSWWSRGLGTAGAVLAALLLILTPPAYTLSLRAETNPVNARIRVQLDTAEVQRRNESGTARISPPFGDRVFENIPVTISDVPTNLNFRCVSLSCEVAGAKGARYWQEIRPPGSSIPLDFSGGMVFPARGTSTPSDVKGFLQLFLSRRAYNAMQSSPVTVSGRLLVQFYEVLPAAQLKPGATGDVAGLGRCRSMTQDNYLGSSLLKVECETADGTVPFAQAKLQWPGHDLEWVHAFGDSYWGQAPRLPWLTPIERRQTSLALTDYPLIGPGSQWQAPREAVPEMQIVITPMRITGYSIVDYRIENIQLKDDLPVLRQQR